MWNQHWLCCRRQMREEVRLRSCAVEMITTIRERIIARGRQRSSSFLPERLRKQTSEAATSLGRGTQAGGKLLLVREEAARTPLTYKDSGLHRLYTCAAKLWTRRSQISLRQSTSNHKDTVAVDARWREFRESTLVKTNRTARSIAPHLIRALQRIWHTAILIVDYPKRTRRTLSSLSTLRTKTPSLKCWFMPAFLHIVLGPWEPVKLPVKSALCADASRRSWMNAVVAHQAPSAEVYRHTRDHASWNGILLCRLQRIVKMLQRC